MEHKNPTEDEQNVKITLMNGGPTKNEPGRLGISEHLNAEEQSAKQKLKKKNIIIGSLFSMFLASFTVNIIQLVQKEALQATPCSSDGFFPHWSQHGNWSYFFSDKEQDWDFSHSNCSAYGASLVTFDSEEERALVKSKENEYWINLQREKADQPWKWPDGSSVNQFEVSGTGFCAYTNGNRVSSTNCDNIRHWICRKPVHGA